MSIPATLHQFSDWGLLALRLGVGITFLVHGSQKRAMWKMQPSAQMPAGLLSLLKVLSIAEPLGGLATLVGLLTQAAAAGFIAGPADPEAAGVGCAPAGNTASIAARVKAAASSLLID